VASAIQGLLRHGPALGVGPSTLHNGTASCEKYCMSNSPVTHHCPYCELNFSYHNEVKDHIIRDHPEHADVVADIEPHELPH
jgi:hypothetical protein